MFYVVTISEKLRLDPNFFAMPLEKGLLNVAKNRLEQSILNDVGMIIAVLNTTPTSDGIVIHGDPAAYYACDVEVLAYKPQINEVVEGEIVELMDFGAFQNLGPLDGLIHLSQITDDFMAYNRKVGAIVGKEKNKSLKKGDIVYSKVATVSLKKNITDSKIGLTMKALGLGKEEWLALKKQKEQKQSSSSNEDRKKEKNN